jgi:hypothetical protein
MLEINFESSALNQRPVTAEWFDDLLMISADTNQTPAVNEKKTPDENSRGLATWFRLNGLVA